MILGGEALDKLRRSHVAVFCLGGVGSYVTEALCRAGVGELTLIDGDTVSVTNINRQLYALHSTVGLPKAEAAAARCRDICPDTVVHPIVGIYDAAHREDFFAAFAQQPFQQVRNRFLSAAPLPRPLEKLRRMLKKRKE